MKFLELEAEKGIALVMVLILLLIICLTLTVLFTSRTTQFNVFTTTGPSSLALTRAEDGLATAYAALRFNPMTNFSPGDNFQLTSADGWNINVQFLSVGTVDRIRSTATLGRYTRTVEVDTKMFGGNAFTSGGTLTLASGSYDLHGNSFYSQTGIDTTGANLSGSGILTSSGNVAVKKNADAKATSNYPSQDINTFDFNAIQKNATRTIDVTSSSFNIADDLRATAKGDIIVINVKYNGATEINISGGSFNDINATVVIVKGDPNAEPILTVGIGNYSNCEINTFVEGNVNFNSGNFITSGVMYATGDISMKSGNYQISGGVVCGGNIDITAASFDNFEPNWNKFKQYFSNSNFIGISNWREL